MNMKRLFCLLTVLALMLGCAAASAEGLRSLTVTEPVHLIGYLPLYTAIHEGYFAEEGLDVTVVQATGGSHVTAVVSGDAFAVIGGVDSNCLANQGNSDPVTAIVNCVNRLPVRPEGAGACLGQPRRHGGFPEGQDDHCGSLRRQSEPADPVSAAAGGS